MHAATTAEDRNHDVQCMRFIVCQSTISPLKKVTAMTRYRTHLISGGYCIKVQFNFLRMHWIVSIMHVLIQYAFLRIWRWFLPHAEQTIHTARSIQTIQSNNLRRTTMYCCQPLVASIESSSIWMPSLCWFHLSMQCSLVRMQGEQAMYQTPGKLLEVYFVRRISSLELGSNENP